MAPLKPEAKTNGKKKREDAKRKGTQQNVRQNILKTSQPHSEISEKKRKFNSSQSWKDK